MWRVRGSARWLWSAGMVIAGMLVGRPVAAETEYVVEDLGTLAGDSSSVAWAINEDGDVVGWSTGPEGTRAFVYTDAGGMVALPGLPDRPRTIARDINDAGVVVGSANAGGTDIGRAVIWSDGSAVDLGTLGTGEFSEAWGLNNLGEVVGWSFTDGANGLTGVHAFLYTQAGELLDLTPESDNGSALDINDAGQVTGYMTAFGGYHAFLGEREAIDLGVLPEFAHSFGLAVSSSGQVAGNVTSASGDSERLFRFVDGAMQDLGGQGEHNAAFGINAGGTVVGMRGQSGKRAIIYSDADGLRDLDSVVDASLGWVLLAAHDINDAGEIVGYGANNLSETTHAVRLRPVSEPSPGDPPQGDPEPDPAAGCSATSGGGGGALVLVVGLLFAFRRRRGRHSQSRQAHSTMPSVIPNRSAV